MSLSSANTATPKTPTHVAPHAASHRANHHHPKPSVESTNGRLTPTDTAQAVGLTGDHLAVQNEQGRADFSNPLTSVATQFNSQIAASRI